MINQYSWNDVAGGEASLTFEMFNPAPALRILMWVRASSFWHLVGTLQKCQEHIEFEGDVGCVLMYTSHIYSMAGDQNCEIDAIQVSMQYTVVPHKAMAEVSEWEPYRRGWWL